MSSSVVPFHPGMRLGQGYNTFTQETTINDAVQKLDGVRATDGDLQHAAERFLDAKETVTAPEILSTPTGHLARQTGKVSQTIKWEALIIRHLSDVTKRMDLSGAHIIKNDARGTNTKVRGYFVDEVAFGNADLNYLFHVDVVNQKLVAHEVNQFVPLRNVPPARFTEVYGDGFVSGFLEGGTFNALVSVKLTQSTPPEAFERAFTSALGIGRMGSLGFNEVGHSTGSVSAADLLSAHETSISVSWTGGGKIRPVDATDWDIVSLKEAAMNFPDAVAECPDRVSAIITKYTALRSFYQQSRRGVPLTYENAGFYAHGLMDQYTDYKVLSSRTRALINHMQEDSTPLYEQKVRKDFAAVAAAMNKFYVDSKAALAARQQLVPYAGFIQGRLTTGPEPVSLLDELLPPNPLLPYKATIIGLETALRDIYLEMKKIAKRVDLLAVFPQVLNDANRPQQFISPAIFRLLIPSKTASTDPAGTDDSDTEAAVEALRKERDIAVVAVKALEKERDIAVVSSEVLNKEKEAAVVALEQVQEKVQADQAKFQQETEQAKKDFSSSTEVLKKERDTAIVALAQAQKQEQANQAKSQQEIEQAKRDLSASSEVARQKENELQNLTVRLSDAQENADFSTSVTKFWKAKLKNGVGMETRLQVKLSNGAQYDGIEVGEKLDQLLLTWAQGPSASLPFRFVPANDFVKRDGKGVDNGLDFVGKFCFIRRGLVVPDLVYDLKIRAPGEIVIDFHRWLLLAGIDPDQQTQIMKLHGSRIDLLRQKGLNFSLGPLVGSSPDKGGNNWEHIPQVDEYDVVRRITFFLANNSIVGLAITTDKFPESILPAANIMDQGFTRRVIELLDDIRILRVELFGGFAERFTDGKTQALTAAWFWTTDGRKEGFDLYPDQPHRPKWQGTPPIAGYVLKGFWGGYGEIYDRVGVIWGIDAPKEEQYVARKVFCPDYDELQSASWRKFVDGWKKPGYVMSRIAGTLTEDSVTATLGEIDEENGKLKGLSCNQGGDDLYGFKFEYSTGKNIFAGVAPSGTGAWTAIAMDGVDRIVSVTIRCTPSQGRTVPFHVKFVGANGAEADVYGSRSDAKTWFNASSTGRQSMTETAGRGLFLKGVAVQRASLMIYSMAVIWGPQ